MLCYAMPCQLHLLPFKCSRVNTVANFITTRLKKYSQIVQQCRSLGCTMYINWGTCGSWVVVFAHVVMPGLMIRMKWMWQSYLTCIFTDTKHYHLVLGCSLTFAGQVPLQFILVCFPNSFAHIPILALENNHGSHILPHVNIVCPDDR